MMRWMFRGGVHPSPGAVPVPFLARLRQAWRQPLQALRGSTTAILRGDARIVGGSDPATVENKVVFLPISGFTPQKQQTTITQKKWYNGAPGPIIHGHPQTLVRTKIPLCGGRSLHRRRATRSRI